MSELTIYDADNKPYKVYLIDGVPQLYTENFDMRIPCFTFQTRIIDGENNLLWYKNGQRHRSDGPAVEGTKGQKFWYIKGKLHRLDGPAVEWHDGRKFWFLNGECYSKTRHLEKVKELI